MEEFEFLSERKKKEAKENDIAKQARQLYLSNLKQLLHTPFGYEFVIRILKDFFACKAVNFAVLEVSLRNYSELLLDDIFEVDPQKYTEILVSMRIKKVEKGE